MSAKYPGGFITKSPVAPTSSAASGVWTLDQALQYTKAGTWPTPGAWVDDVFSAYTYTGNGSTQTITNGIDLAGKGGLVWIKLRGSSANHALFDTVSGATTYLRSDQTAAANTLAGTLTSFDSTGFSLGSSTLANTSAGSYVSWTFRKAPKFFDVVTYTGTGANRTIAHSLGQAPGMIITKRTDTTGNWITYHRSLGNTDFVNLNTTAVTTADSGAWNNTSPTSTDFSLGTGDTNVSGGTYVAYLFAHDTATNGIVQCGSFTTDGSGNATVTLGWEPQFVIAKNSGAVSEWKMLDTARGWTATASGNALLRPNTSAAEVTGQADIGYPTATGMDVKGLTASSTYIYLAIRRPNKPPTTGTQVYGATAYTGNVSSQTITTGYPPISDLVLVKPRTDTTFNDWLGQWALARKYLFTNLTDAEGSSFIDTYASTGFVIGNSSRVNANTITYISYYFRRAPGVFDVVCYTGTGANTTVAHNLGVTPEMMIVKLRSAAGSHWAVYASALANTEFLHLDATDAKATNTGYWNSTTPTSSVFTIGTNGQVNTSSATYVAYLFATKAGISKVGSYTGNGSSQTINAGFTTGARFVLIKRTDSTGDWYVWDSTRGIVAGNDPHLSLNTTAAEVTTDDSVDTDTSGFIVNQLAATNINVTSATYIYLSFA